MNEPSVTAQPAMRCLSLAGPRDGRYVVTFPHAGGAGTYFRTWAEALPPTVGLVAITYPGRAHRAADTPAGSIDEIAYEVAAALDLLGGRQVFFGHSLGGLIAHQTALQVREPPAALLVSACHSPLDPQPDNGFDRSDEQIWTELVDLNGTPDELRDSTEVRDLILPVLRSDYRLAATAQPPSRTLTIPVVALRGDQDPAVSEKAMQEWSALTTGPFHVRRCPGDHFYLNRERALILDECVGWLQDTSR